MQDELSCFNEKLEWVSRMAQSVVFYGQPVIGGQGVPLKVYDGSENWVRQIEDRTPELERLAIKFGKLKDFETLSQGLYTTLRRRPAKKLFRDAFLKIQALHKMVFISYPITIDVDEKIMLVVDAIKLLLLKMERNLRMYCQELGEDLPEWEEINVIPEPGTATIIGFSGRSAPGSDQEVEAKPADGLPVSLKIGSQTRSKRISPMTCMVYSLDFDDLSEEYESAVQIPRQVSSLEAIRSNPEFRSFHLKHLLRDITWDRMENWLRAQTNEKGKRIFSDTLDVVESRPKKWLISLVFGLWDQGYLKKSLDNKSQTFEVVGSILMETFQHEIKDSTFDKIISNQVGYERIKFNFSELKRK